VDGGFDTHFRDKVNSLRPFLARDSRIRPFNMVVIATPAASLSFGFRDALIYPLIFFHIVLRAYIYASHFRLST
jgi:hypothetical protein